MPVARLGGQVVGQRLMGSWFAIGRPASDSEKTTMFNFIERQKSLRAEKDNAEELAVQDFCHLILCLNEFLYIE